jgi:hypothetical protein
MSEQTVTTTTTVLQSGAFAALFSGATGGLPQNSAIDLVINIGDGPIDIQDGAFQQSAIPLGNGITINSAAFNFSNACQPTLGSNFMANLPVSTLTLPSQTTLQANALENIPGLRHLDASKLTTPVVTGGLNLSRDVEAPLVVEMPSSNEVSFASRSVVLPRSAAGSTTTLVFDGAVPTTVQLNQMFGFQPQSANVNPAPVQVSLNYATTSSVTNQQLSNLQTNLTQANVTPTSVSFNQVSQLIQNLAQGAATQTVLQDGGALSDLSQFAGDYFDYCMIASKQANNAKAIKQCVVTSLSASAIQGNVQTIPIPSAITPSNLPKHNVTALVSSMQINQVGLTPTTFYIIDNHIDPTDDTLPPVPLVAIFSKDNALAGGFFPALLCNGSVSISDQGSVVVSGRRGGGAADSYCKGYNAVSAGAAQINNQVDLLAAAATGSQVLLYNRSQDSNQNSIAKLTFPTDSTFAVTFNPVSKLDGYNDPVVGCMQGYLPKVANASMVASFTNLANDANSTWNIFSNSVATLISKNNGLMNLFNRIRTQAIPAGLPLTVPTATTIESELINLSKSDFKMALSNWKILHNKFVTTYQPYMNAINAYVDNAILQLGAQSTTEYVNAKQAFTNFKAEIDLQEDIQNTPDAQRRNVFVFVQSKLTEVNGVSPTYSEAVSVYLNRRLSLGMQTFKNCTLLDAIPHFEFLRNLSIINPETFNFCSVLKSPINIPSNVTEIGKKAFYLCSDSTGIDIQNAFSLRVIGESAFEGCAKASGNLAFSCALNQPDSVEYIGDKAFNGCSSLTGHLYFPPKLRYIGVSAFQSCSNLNGTIVFPRNANFTFISESAFADCISLTGVSTNTGNGTSLVYLNRPEYGNDVNLPILNGLIIPSNVSEIRKNAFLNCSKFEGILNLQLSNTSSIKKIDDGAFNGCVSFSSLVLPSVPEYTVVSSECFNNCSGLTKLTIPPNVVTIMNSAFSGCVKVANVPNLDNVISIGMNAFNNCNSMTGPLVLGSKLNILGDKAFFDCSFLTSATFLGAPTIALTNANQIFGTTNGLNTPFYINVFSENGWDGTGLTSANTTVVINKSFRALANPGGKSLVKMSYIDFNTYVASPSSREITINNYQSFKVYDNSNASNDANAETHAESHSWNDVYIPITFIGEDLASAKSNVNPAPLLQSEISRFISPITDQIQSIATDMVHSSNTLLNAFDGRNMTVKVSTDGAPIELNSAATQGANSNSANWYGVYIDTNVMPNKHYLYFAATNGVASALVKNSNHETNSFFVTSSTLALAMYQYKLITVNADGLIHIVNSIKPIGYGNNVNAVVYTSNKPTTDRTGMGYSIFKSSTAGALDTLYIDTILAPAGTYFISNVGVAGTVSDADKYKVKTVNVKSDGSMHILQDQLENDFKIITANAITTAGELTAVGQYGILTSQQSGANTPSQLLYKSSNDVASKAPSNHYLIKTSNNPAFNNVMVLVDSNGGISTSSAGIQGTVSRLESYIDSLISQQIPIYSSNQEFMNFDHHIGKVYTVAQTQYNDSARDFKQKVTNVVTKHGDLHKYLSQETSSMKNAIIGASPTAGNKFMISFDAVDASYQSLINPNNGKLSNYMNANNAYDELLTDMRKTVDGFTNANVVGNVNGLRTIQANVLNNVSGIYQFRRESTFNSNALAASVNPEIELVNDPVFVAQQIDAFLKEILFTEYLNKTALSDLFTAVKTTVSFTVSPSTDTVPKKATYNNLSPQQQILFDFVSSFVQLWFNSMTPDVGGNQFWGDSISKTKLWSVVFIENNPIDQFKDQLLAWGKTHIVSFFASNGADLYSQFTVNTQPDTVATLANIRTSIQTYDALRNAPNNKTYTEANVFAKAAYVDAASVKLNITATNTITLDTETSEPNEALPNGKLRFNAENQTQSQIIYISLKDAQATDIKLEGYFDRIKLNNSIVYDVTAVTKTSKFYKLNVQHVDGTGAADSVTNPVVFFTYQTVNDNRLRGLELVNDYVWSQYHQSQYTIDGVTVNGINNALIQIKTKLKSKTSDLLLSLNELNGLSHEYVENMNTLNKDEDSLIASLQSTPSSGTSLALNGANMLAREVALFQNELLNVIYNNETAVPLLESLPSYESKWFSDRVAAFWVAYADANAGNKPTPDNRQTIYTTNDTAFAVARYNRQKKAIASYIANTPPSQSILSPVNVSFISDQASAMMKTMPAYWTSTSSPFDSDHLARDIAEEVAFYVWGRKMATLNVTGDVAIATARQNYQDAMKKQAADALLTADIAYGQASYQRYISLIDLAIAKGYYAGILTYTNALVSGATNQFQTNMQQWNAASSYNKDALFKTSILPLLYNMVYRTDFTNTYSNYFPLKGANSEMLSWFGDSQNDGYLKLIVKDGLTLVNNLMNLGTMPYSKYLLDDGRNVSYVIPNGTTSAFTVTDNKITYNTVPYTIINPATTPTVTPTTMTTIQYATALKVNSESSTTNPFNLQARAQAANDVSSPIYNVVGIGHSSVSSALATGKQMTSLGFTNVTGNANLNFNISTSNNVLLYQFKFNRGDGDFQYGYEQPTNLMNSWAKVSPNQRVVVFYAGNQAGPPANLFEQRNSINALCDDATFVMTIDSTSVSTVSAVSIYKYDALGVDSGELIAAGIITTNGANNIPTLYSVTGALENNASNPPASNGINLVGDLVIHSNIKVIGVKSFSKSNGIKSLKFVDGSNSMNINSNAFEQCGSLLSINLGQNISAIGPSAFLKCTGATSLVLPPITSSFSVVNHWAFLGCNKIGTSATNANLVLNNNIKEISVQAFAGCHNLKCSSLSENIPLSLERIGHSAFIGCKSLTGALNFNSNQNGLFISNVKTVGSAAFMGCVGLNGNLSLPDNSEYKSVLPYTFSSMDSQFFDISNQGLVTPLSTWNAFFGTNLNQDDMNKLLATQMSLTGNVDFTLNKVIQIERNSFHKCSKLESVKLSNVISYVGVQSFLGCSGFKTNLTIPASVKSVGDEAFKGCSGLPGLNIMSTMVSQVATEAWLSLGKSCFQDCTSLADSNTSSGIVIPSSVGYIGDSAFQGCTSIPSVNIGSGLTKADSFGSLVFSGCVKLQRVTVSFSYLSRDVAGKSVVKNAVLPVPNPTSITYNASFTGCTLLGVPSDNPSGTIQIMSGATGWTPGRAAFFNNLTIVINNKNITFYLKEFNQNINVVDPSTEPLQQEAIPLTDAQATVYIKASDMRNVFLTSTDSYVTVDAVNNEGSDRGQLFFVRPEYFPKYLNVANAQVVQGGIESYNAAIYEQLVKDDVMRYYAMSLFNSADWVTLFANDTEMIENMVASSGLMPVVPDGNVDQGINLHNTGVLHNIMAELAKVGYASGTNSKLVSSTNYPLNGTKWKGLPDTVLPEQGNIGKKLFSIINRNDPNRINSMVLNGVTPSNLPFLPGDQFIFIFTLNENSVTLTPGIPPVVIKKRSYLIKMILTDDFVSGDSTFSEHFKSLYNPSPLNLNVLPVSGAYAADHMYSNYNMYLAIKPSVTNQTDSTVYSRITQNTFEPIPTPQALLPFTGWYYSYRENTQAIRLNFTPPEASVQNKMYYSDLRYFSAYMYFPENWSSGNSLPSIDNFPQWVVSFYNGNQHIVIKYKANFLSKNAETVNYLGQTVAFDHSNTHVQLLCPFEILSNEVNNELVPLLNGRTATNQSGTINYIAGTKIYRQRDNFELVSGLRKSNSKVGPFTYPPVSRGYQCINMPTYAPFLTTGQILVDGGNPNSVSDIMTQLIANQQFYLESIYLEINMSNNNGFVPNVIVKSAEVVVKTYDAYYLAPLDPN